VGRDQLLDRAARISGRLGHDWIASEHLLLALVAADTRSARALRACGLVCGDLFETVSRWPSRRGRLRHPTGDRLILGEAQRILARAEGIAVGRGCGLDCEHVLLALLWEPGEPAALRLLEDAGVSRATVLSELRRHGAPVPEVQLLRNASVPYQLRLVAEQSLISTATTSWEKADRS
jgi:ATP-dependent Clp protease ATP-binding subunit ClpA